MKNICLSGAPESKIVEGLITQENMEQ